VGIKVNQKGLLEEGRSNAWEKKKCRFAAFNDAELSEGNKILQGKGIRKTFRGGANRGLRALCRALYSLGRWEEAQSIEKKVKVKRNASGVEKFGPGHFEENPYQKKFEQGRAVSGAIGIKRKGGRKT